MWNDQNKKPDRKDDKNELNKITRSNTEENQH